MNKIIAPLADLQWANVLILGAVVGVVYYFLMFNDGSALREEITNGGIRLEEAKASLAQTEKAMQNANRFEREVRETARQFESIVDYMPTTMSPADLHGIITKNASLAGVRVSKLEPKGPDVTSGFYQTTRMAMVLEGTFGQIVSFLANLSRTPNLLTLEDAEIRTSETQTNTQSLIFEGVLVGYRYLREQPSAEGTPAPGQDAAAPATGGGE